jgi:hypothetical protein
LKHRPLVIRRKATCDDVWDDIVALIDAAESAPKKRGPYTPHQPKAAGFQTERVLIFTGDITR